MPRANRRRCSRYSKKIIFNGKSISEETSFLISISAKSFDYLSEISIPFNQDTRLEITEASVLDKSGTVLRKLSKKEIVTRSDISDGSLYEDDLVKEFTLRWNEYPYFIKYSYRQTYTRFVSLAYWSPLVYRNAPTLLASLSVEIPYGTGYSQRSSGSFEFRTDSLEKTLVLNWTARNVAPPAEQNYAPPYPAIIPFVEVIPTFFNYGVSGSLFSWASYGEWHDKLLSGLLDLPDTEKQTIDRIISGAGDKREMAKRIYYYMQDNTRYINVAIDEGGLIPYPASYVCRNRYGDCKALSVYMMAALKHAGIESNYVLVYAGDYSYPADNNFPSPRFNHAMLCLPLDGDTVWLENTNSLVPFGYNSSQTSGRHCLLVDGSKSRLVYRQPLKLDELLINSVISLEPESSGDGKMRIRKTMRGSDFTKYLYVKNDITDSERDEIIKDYAGLKNEIISFSINHSDRDLPYLEINSELRVPSLLRKIGATLVFSFPAIKVLKLEKPTDRTLPVIINSPRFVRDSIIINLKNLQGYSVKLPAPVYINSDFGHFALKFTQSNKYVIVERELLLERGIISIDNYNGLYDFVEELSESMKKNALIFNIKQ